jgi:hypothetical protein
MNGVKRDLSRKGSAVKNGDVAPDEFAAQLIGPKRIHRVGS